MRIEQWARHAASGGRRSGCRRSARGAGCPRNSRDITSGTRRSADRTLTLYRIPELASVYTRSITVSKLVSIESDALQPDGTRRRERRIPRGAPVFHLTYRTITDGSSWISAPARTRCSGAARSAHRRARHRSRTRRLEIESQLRVDVSRGVRSQFLHRRLRFFGSRSVGRPPTWTTFARPRRARSYLRARGSVSASASVVLSAAAAVAGTPAPTIGKTSLRAPACSGPEAQLSQARNAELIGRGSALDGRRG